MNFVRLLKYVVFVNVFFKRINLQEFLLTRFMWNILSSIIYFPIFFH